MHTPNRLLFIATFLLALVELSTAMADDHVVVERARSGMGMRSPVRVSEIWLSETSVYTKGSRFITIERYDLKKRWTVSLQTKRFYEAAITTSSNASVGPVAIQRAGWDYEPVYDWALSESQRTDTICGFRCRLIVAEGEADYSSEMIELWVADRVPVQVKRFNERVASPSAEFNWESLAKAYPTLRRAFVVKCVDKQDHPIAPLMSYETTVTKIETAPAPAGLYDIPEGYQRVNTLEDLTK